MIVSISIVKGFQNEIKNKVVNFSSHIQVTAGGTNYSFESSPIIKDETFIKNSEHYPEINHVQTFATKPGLIQSKADTQFLTDDKIKVIRDIEGIIFKGLDHDFNWDFMVERLVEGAPFTVKENKLNDSILISKYLSKKLKLNLHDPIACYFLKDNGTSTKKFIVAGIYETGLEEFDKQFTFIDIKHVQKLNGWGVQASLFLNENFKNNKLTIEARVAGGNGNNKYNWGDVYSNSNSISISPTRDTTIYLATRDYIKSNVDFSLIPNNIPDSAWLNIKIDGPLTITNGEFEYEAINNTVRRYTSGETTITTTLSSTGGSMKYYVGGYEVFINNNSTFKYDINKHSVTNGYRYLKESLQGGINKFNNNLDEAEKILYEEADPLLKITKITSRYQEIFGWLSILDTNVFVIIILMIMVSIINIISLILVLIIERSNMIGLLKSFGAENITIQRIFISLGSHIMIRGLIIGNVVAYLLIYLQSTFGFIKLPQENYYLSTVPMSVEPLHFLLVNGITIVCCFLILMLTSLFIAKINPIKVIKFE